MEDVDFGYTERTFRLRHFDKLECRNVWALVYDDTQEIYGEKIFTSKEAAMKYMSKIGGEVIREVYFEPSPNPQNNDSRRTGTT